MVSRIKNTNTPNCLTDARWNVLKADLLATRNAHVSNSKCYRDCTIDLLTTLYKNKCAICERDRGIELQVDHYRPKKARTNITHTQYNNTGYYWLTYTWSNLIPLCSACNQKKSNKFPIASGNTRVTDHVNSQGLNPFNPYDINWLKLIESPLLLNPETDNNLSSHFICDKNGELKGRTSQGWETIKVFKLNRRELKRKRISVKNKITKEIIISFDRFITHQNDQRLKGALEIIFDRLIHGTNIDHELSLYYTFIFKYFNYFIGSRIPSNIRDKVMDYFEEYKLENAIA